MKPHAGQNREEFEPVARRIRDRAAFMLRRLPVEDPGVVAARRRALDLEKRELLRDPLLYLIKSEAVRIQARNGDE